MYVYIYIHIYTYKHTQIHTYVYVKLKFDLEPATKLKEGWRDIGVHLYCFFNLSARLGWMVNATLRSLYPGRETRYLLYRRLGGPQGRSGRVLGKSHFHRDSIAVLSRSESLYHLSYSGPSCLYITIYVNLRCFHLSFCIP